MNIYIAGRKGNRGRILESKCKEYFKDARIIDLDLRKQNLLDYNISDNDLIILSLPPEAFTEYYQALIEYNYRGYLLAEKPAAISVEDLELLRRLGSISKRIMIGYQYIYSPLIRFMKDMKDREYGALRSLSCVISHGLAFKKDFHKSWRANNSSVKEIGLPHICSIFFLLSKELTYRNCIEHSIYGSGIKDTYSIQIADSDTCYQGTYSWGAPCEMFIYAIFENAIIRADEQGANIQYPRECFDSRGYYCRAEWEQRKDLPFDDSSDGMFEKLRHAIENRTTLPFDIIDSSIESLKFLTHRYGTDENI